MGFERDPQLAFQRPTGANPKLSDGNTAIEFTTSPQPGSTVKYELASSLQTTIGGSRRIQSDSLVRVVRISWIEPSNFIPTTILRMQYGGGDRTIPLTYTHHRPILSQLEDNVEATDGNGIIPITGFIMPPFDFQFIGTDEGGTQEWQCSMVFVESDEVQP